MRSLDDLFAALAKSGFRARFQLQPAEAAYLRSHGLETVLAHSREFLLARLAPPQPANDGRQTPMRGHPSFVAQHATATCCRGCLAKWHHIPAGRQLTEQELNYLVAVHARWLVQELATAAPPAIEQPSMPRQQELF